MVNTVWKDRKRIIFGLPWTFTKYGLSEDRFFMETGFFNVKEDEVRLYRITDVSVSRSFWQRLFNLGTITCHSSDRTLKTFEIKNIKKPKEVKELISTYVEDERDRKRVSSREFISGDSGFDNDDDDDDDN
ncbi:MAG: PH domain-containing protein [Lachnospiraceae bacterium]|nr:PH domain-containing protein [Lachnospiraceae bacterium]